jgi:hypothetical protein
MKLHEKGTLLFGLGLALFSAPILVAPRALGRLGGITVADESAASVMRSVAARDLVMGVGLVSAAWHRSRLAPWLLMRTLCDGGDVVAVALAFLRGGGNARLGGLGLVALTATVYDLLMWRLARADRLGAEGPALNP